MEKTLVAAALPLCLIAIASRSAADEEHSYIRFTTASGSIRCTVSAAQVACQAPFANSPIRDGEHANGVAVAPDGTIDWVLGDLGYAETTHLDHATHRESGWTIDVTDEGASIINDSTGRGVFVSIETVTAL